jgi:hypothetical protein
MSSSGALDHLGHLVLPIRAGRPPRADDEFAELAGSVPASRGFRTPTPFFIVMAGPASPVRISRCAGNFNDHAHTLSCVEKIVC